MSGNINGSSSQFSPQEINHGEGQAPGKIEKRDSTQGSMANLQARIPTPEREHTAGKKVNFKEKSFLAKAQHVIRAVVNVARACWRVFKDRVANCCLCCRKSSSIVHQESSSELSRNEVEENSQDTASLLIKEEPEHLNSEDVEQSATEIFPEAAAEKQDTSSISTPESPELEQDNISESESEIDSESSLGSRISLDSSGSSDVDTAQEMLPQSSKKLLKVNHSQLEDINLSEDHLEQPGIFTRQNAMKMPKKKVSFDEKVSVRIDDTGFDEISLGDTSSTSSEESPSPSVSKIEPMKTKKSLRDKGKSMQKNIASLWQGFKNKKPFSKDQ